MIQQSNATCGKIFKNCRLAGRHSSNCPLPFDADQPLSVMWR
jgi:hypothetical protein